ncbi:DUF4333 domain-containing protein [Actinokineospora sp. UTMC 2448]|uniref:DUF4333 domain-containing protein n=1 Tax=Actinokineospora sp. UTMC 2448 TaxID=2268449 RepID=UPI002164204D|nr:DUF4333 domain-containing protein [Actinokineospora sp. UTMC 2448]UVS79046.1 hypothetical protein Actkin_02787 [Actinokineospora sp. UTMC 2448]
MSSPYGPSGGQDPQQPWGQQPYGGGQVPGPPSGGFPAQGYPQQGYPQQGQPQYGYGQQQPQPTQQYPGGGYQPYGDQHQQPYGEQQQQYPGYGQQQYPGQQPKKKSNGLIWGIVAVVVLAVGAVVVLGFVTPGWFNKRVFDNTAVQDGVKTVLVNDYGADDGKIESVSCPEGEPVTKDHRFTCKVKYDGQEFQVDITVRDESNGQYEVANPNLPD